MPPPALPAPAPIREAAARALGDGSLQRDLPAAPEPVGLALPDGLARLLQLALGAALAVAFALAVLWLWRRLRDRPRDAEGGAAAEAVASEALSPARAEALAAQGRYGEAIHALLLETLAALSRGARLAPSLTSREIVRGVPLAPAARDALSGLVLAAEASHFGGAVPDLRDYEGCLARYRSFLEARGEAA